MQYKDREQAGKLLADALQQYKNQSDTIVIGLPRGGVPIAYEVADALSLPLDVIVPRKIGAPMQPELAVGAVTEDGTVLFNDDVMGKMGLHPDDVQDIIQKEKKESQRRVELFRKGESQLDLEDKTVILVDDGVATGATMRAAIASAQKRGAGHIVLALPVAPQRFRDAISSEVDEVVILHEPAFFPAVGYFYQKFDQVQDEEVVRILEKHTV